MQQASPLPPVKISRWHHSTVLTIAFITGACGIAYEYTFSKLAADLLGNTIHEWALTIAVMLFAMGVGAELQKRIDQSQLFMQFIVIELLLSLLGAWGGMLLLSVFALKRLQFAFVQMLLHFAVGVFIGMEIPLLVRMNRRFTHSLKHNLGELLRLDYWGGFVGALLWIYGLSVWLPTTLSAAFVISLVNLSGAALALLSYRNAYQKPAGGFFKRNMQLWILSSAIFISAGSCLYGLLRLPHWTPALEQHLFADPVILSQNTPYQHIVLTKNAQNELRMYLNGHLQFSSKDEAIYHEFLVHPALFVVTRQKKVGTAYNALILGGGDGLALRELLKYNNVSHVTLVDIDGDLIQLAQTHPELRALNHNSLSSARVVQPKASRVPFMQRSTQQLPIISRSTAPQRIVGTALVELYTLDAYAFLKEAALNPASTPRYNVIIADFPDPNSLELSKLYTRSFYHYLKTQLKPNGVLIQQASSPYYAKETFALIGRTLSASGFAVVPVHALVPSFGEWGWYIAQQQTFTDSAQLYQLLYEHFNPQVPVKNLDNIAMQRALLFSPHQHPLTAAQEAAPTNTLLNHLAFKTYYRELKAFR